MLAQLLLGPSIFVDRSLAILIEPALLLGIVLGMVHQAFRPLGSDRFQEIATAYLQAVIDELLELAGPTDRQMSLEDHPVKAGENADDKAGKLGDEGAYCLHGHPLVSE